LLRAFRVAPVLTSVAFTAALGTTAPVASIMLPVRALLVPLCPAERMGLIAVNTERRMRLRAVRILIRN
jgi:hypothetical protein